MCSISQGRSVSGVWRPCAVAAAAADDALVEFALLKEDVQLYF